ncbi:MAG TPA: YlbF family regulator [Anaerolineales bacterium]|nr:YlbF family regulator [Anaerolineales bacterium]
MDDKVLDDLETAPPSIVLKAARDFAAALAETPQFKSFEQAADRFQNDQTAQQAMSAYREKQKDLRALIMLNALSAEQQTELERVKDAFLGQPLVQEYFKAQTELVILCQILGDTLSESIGLDYASACGVSCCG